MMAVASIVPGVPAKVISMSLEHSDSETTCAGSEEGSPKSTDPRFVSARLDLNCFFPEGGDTRVARRQRAQGASRATADRAKAEEAGLRTDGRTALRTRAAEFVPAAMITAGQVSDPGSLDQIIDATAATTLMLHNIPKSHSQDMLIDMLDDLGVLQECDFLYLPAKLETGMNFGYAFINTTSAEAAKRLSARYQLYCKAEYQSMRFCPVSLSKMQGLLENIRRYQTSPIMGPGVPDKFKPVLLQHGKRVPFPLSGPPSTMRRRKIATV